MLHYIAHLHVNVAGLLIATGIGLAALTWFEMRHGHRWAWVTAITLPVVFLAHSLPVHQSAEFSFDAIQHFGPGVVWLPALVIGGVLSYRGLRSIGRELFSSPGRTEYRPGDRSVRTNRRSELGEID